MIEIIVYLTTDRIESIESHNKDIRSGLSYWTYEVIIGLEKILMDS